MNNTMMIPEEQSAGILSMKDCLNAVRAAFLKNEEGTITMGGRIAMPLGDGNAAQWLTAVSTDPPIYGVKASQVFGKNAARGLPVIQSVISLYSGENGTQLAMIGANFLTDLKTGAAAGVATDEMANPDASRLGVIGTGAQAYTQVMAIQEVRRLTQLRLYDTTRERMETCAEKIRTIQNAPYEIIFCETAEDCVRNSDIISTCTPSLTPVFDASALQPGTHINAVGAYRPDMQELSEEAVCRASFIITEHADAIWNGPGDVTIPLGKGLFGKEKVRGGVGALLAGSVPGRTDAQEITLFESMGSGVLDVSMAIAVYDAVRNS